MTKAWLHIVFIFSITIIISIAVIIFYCPLPDTPEKEMQHARETLILARNNEAYIYSPDLYNEASLCYDSAMIHWSLQNGRFILNRDYSKVIRFAELSSNTALKASEISLNNSTNLRINFNGKLEEAEKLIILINRSYSFYPLPSKVRNDISEGKMLVHEAKVAFDKGSYYVADEKITESISLLSASYKYAGINIHDYFRPYPLWRTWIDSTINYSLQDSAYSIIIDKFSHRFFVYLNGGVFSEFKAELGENWVGDKQWRGDKATPEGMYRIIKLMEKDSTGYYKALLLDYPNAKDSASFRRSVLRGTIPGTSRLGDKIEIHGEGGRGADWTAGCIALRNRDMDSLFKYVRIGTPVTIVGSMKDRRQALR